MAFLATLGHATDICTMASVLYYADLASRILKRNGPRSGVGIVSFILEPRKRVPQIEIMIEEGQLHLRTLHRRVAQSFRAFRNAHRSSPYRSA